MWYHSNGTRRATHSRGTAPTGALHLLLPKFSFVFHVALVSFAITGRLLLGRLLLVLGRNFRSRLRAPTRLAFVRSCCSDWTLRSTQPRLRLLPATPAEAKWCIYKRRLHLPLRCDEHPEVPDRVTPSYARDTLLESNGSDKPRRSSRSGAPPFFCLCPMLPITSSRRDPSAGDLSVPIPLDHGDNEKSRVAVILLSGCTAIGGGLTACAGGNIKLARRYYSVCYV